LATQNTAFVPELRVHDSTLGPGEYLAPVEMRFATADSDHHGTLDAKELNSATGRAFPRLVT
jgi:hypothetical protein